MKNATIKEALKGASLQLKEAGIPGCGSEGVLLLAFCMKKDRVFIYAHPEEEISSEQLEHFQELVRKRVSGVPYHYIVGSKEFMGLDFKVTPEVLVPRPETEILCQTVLDYIEGRYLGPLRLLDLCCGSGVLAVTLAKRLPSCRVWAVDLCPKALKVAKENAEFHRVSKKITFLEGDLWEPLRVQEELTFHVVVSNPPYVATGELAALQREVKGHEPLLALQGGKDGLNFYRRIFGSLHNFLKPQGMTALEMGKGQMLKVKSLAASTGIFETLDVVKDYSGIERVLVALSGKNGLSKLP
ncbi:peptide chain release factor N(5)-glutamine methyltransferase [Candidatus Contubernalis alkaliaceticus]|uniref:peptide chain release factor N(5)-glutamine methyltransferase n=1 Tax=Candidatus Contubernalis alkaliaceticus TaxID=338645 RepID=UPI001F4C2B1B|nr:peptide chain release factor N(5)-glutamine methyltransferase [Candidatus Contubernalis alkalaceticus]UNC93683.1 peptide chain release factor N(5)-glutamine methyltransferase [Candidatus Contubernalis alkalaceticus]